MATPRMQPDKIQLQQDIIDVFCLRIKKLSEFPPARQKLICDAYRFWGIQYESDDPMIASRTSDTLDII